MQPELFLPQSCSHGSGVFPMGCKELSSGQPRIEEQKSQIPSLCWHQTPLVTARSVKCL